MPKNYDAIVIGGGTIGCSVAWRLAETGRQVVPFERVARMLPVLRRRVFSTPGPGSGRSSIPVDKFSIDRFTSVRRV